MTFHKAHLDLKGNAFEHLSNPDNYSSSFKGRRGGILVDCQDGSVPIVRTTTEYSKGPLEFTPMCKEICKEILEKIKVVSTTTFDTTFDTTFNNAMIECYTNDYKTMGFHTDQSLDLEDDSVICIFSCYRDDLKSNRSLITQNKATGHVASHVMAHNSIIWFNVQTNREHVHKIILNGDNNEWIGLTFRCSKTFVTFRDNVPYINDKELRLATAAQRVEFMKLKGEENRSILFKYPELDYTINPSDLIGSSISPLFNVNGKNP